MSARNDGTQKRSYKYKCLEACCHAVVDDKKWHRHCETKHRFKTANHMIVKRTIFEYRLGKGPWLPYEGATSISQSHVTVQESESDDVSASPVSRL
jgi:hypothetical protein